jgi:hypothetical protein
MRKPPRRGEAIYVIIPAEHKRVISATKSRHGIHQHIENLLKVGR